MLAFEAVAAATVLSVLGLGYINADRLQNRSNVRILVYDGICIQCESIKAALAMVCLNYIYTLSAYLHFVFKHGEQHK